MNRRFALTAALVAILLAGCASGPKFNTVEKGLPTLAAGKARVYFYRTTTLGGAIQPAVQVNGAVVGKAEPMASGP
jgi:outer membrane murein-binding lipoprotein Lpp